MRFLTAFELESRREPILGQAICHISHSRPDSVNEDAAKRAVESSRDASVAKTQLKSGGERGGVEVDIRSGLARDEDPIG